MLRRLRSRYGVRHGRLAAVPALLVATALGVGTAASPARAHDVVIFDEAGLNASQVGLIGDSTLAGVRWADSYGALRRYNFVLDAESCRRTLERSCWSREQYRPSTALSALQQRSGSWGQAMVVMTGYNDAPDDFDDGVDALVAEARRQGIPHVVWLTLREAGVRYEDPLGQTSADTYRQGNRLLYEEAVAAGGYLQIADWAGYSEDRPEWFGSDGVHLSEEGVDALTTFIADQLAVVLAGGNLNPQQIPWSAVEQGDTGQTVAEVQRALLRAGIVSVGDADGVYGPVTVSAVRDFQQRRGLPATGRVGEETAVALGLYRQPAATRPARWSTNAPVAR